MKKSTIAAIAAAAMFGLGAAGTAMADIEVSGFADINYDAFNSDGANAAANDPSGGITAGSFRGSGEEGQFRASGEIDIIGTGAGATVRIDLDLINAHNSSPGADLPTGTGPVAGSGVTGAAATNNLVGPVGIDVEQLNFSVPLIPDMVSVTAGIWNSPFGMEGQDAPDIHFAKNGLLWNYVPSNMAGALVSVTLNDMLSANLGYINGRGNIAGVPALGRDNDVVVTATANVLEGVSVTVGFLSDNGQDPLVNSAAHPGDEVNINGQITMIENLELGAEWMTADPNTGSRGFDSGFAFDAAYQYGLIGVAARYEATTTEGVGSDEDETSLVASYDLTDDTEVRLDYTNHTTDIMPSSISTDTVTIQLLHLF